jgi:hypothetical protein
MYIVDLLAWASLYSRTSRTLTNTSTRLHPYIQAAPTHYRCEKGVWQERWVDGRGIQPSFSLSTPIYTPCLPHCSRTHAISPTHTIPSGTDFSRRPAPPLSILPPKKQGPHYVVVYRRRERSDGGNHDPFCYESFHHTKPSPAVKIETTNTARTHVLDTFLQFLRNICTNEMYRVDFQISKILVWYNTCREPG